jgi:alkylation response protein AidB-like acyl-CoA dehydrogenase
MAPSSTDSAPVSEQNTTKSSPLSEAVKGNRTSDPAVYDLYHQKFAADGLPSTTEAWLERARQVSEILAQDAAARDIENNTPQAEVSLLKSAGLLKVLGPANIGGGGQTWDVGYKIIREIAKGDGSIGMLLGYHLLWSITANITGTNEQKERFQRLIIENNYFVGGKYSGPFQ